MSLPVNRCVVLVVIVSLLLALSLQGSTMRHLMSEIDAEAAVQNQGNVATMRKMAALPQAVPISPEWIRLAEQRASLDYFACAGLGHRLVRMADANTIAQKLQLVLRASWGFCPVDKNVTSSGSVQIFDHMFEPQSISKVLQVPEEALRRPASETPLNVKMNQLVQIVNENPGYKSFYRRGNNACQCTQEKSTQDYEFYDDLRRRFRHSAKVDQFYRDHFDADQVVIGFHVRAGNGEKGGFQDKKRAIRNYDQFAKDSAETLLRLHANVMNNTTTAGNFSIFFATDTPSMVDKVRDALASYNVNVVTYDDQERVGEGKGTFVNDLTGSDCLRNWEDVTMDMMLLSRADVVVSGQPSSFTQSMPMSLKLEAPMSERKVAQNYCEFHPSGRDFRCYGSTMQWCCLGLTNFHKDGLKGSEFRRIVDPNQKDKKYLTTIRSHDGMYRIREGKPCQFPQCILPQFWPQTHTDQNNIPMIMKTSIS